MWRKTSAPEHVISKVILPTAVSIPAAAVGEEWNERKEKSRWENIIDFFCSSEFNLTLISFEFKIFRSCCLQIHLQSWKKAPILSLERAQKRKELMLDKSLLMFLCASERRLLDSHMKEVKPFWNAMKVASEANFSVVLKPKCPSEWRR